MAENAGGNVEDDEFYLTYETTAEEFRGFIRGLIERCGEASPHFPYRVLPNASRTTVFSKRFYIDMDGIKVEMKLVFLEADVYFISWAIPKHDIKSPGYAIFSDIVKEFKEKADAMASPQNFVYERVDNRQRKRKNVRGSGSGSSSGPQQVDSGYLVDELAKGKVVSMGCSYVALTKIGGPCKNLTLDRYSLIRVLQCLYNVDSEKDFKKLASCVLRVLQMIPESMRNSKMLDFVCQKFEIGGKPEQALVERQQEWSESSKKLHRVPVDDSNLTEKERLVNRLLSEEWTLVLAKTEDDKVRIVVNFGIMKRSFTAELY